MEQTNDKAVILIVEDDTTLRRVLKDTLLKENFEVLEAKNGEEGLDVSLKKHPDLILLDIIMPKMDGISMLKKLRENEWGKTALIIMLTNLEDNQKILEALTYNVCDYFIKSDFGTDKMIEIIKEKLKNSNLKCSFK